MTDEKPGADRLRRAFALAAAFAGLLWLIKLAELGFGLDLADFSIYPGRPETLPGLILAPLLHGSLSHLFANTAPILVLGTLLIYGYPKAARILLPAVYLGSGLGVWFFARPAWHLGASGLTFGMMFFVFTVGVLRWDRRAIALSLVVFLLYGGMIWGILPTKPNVSFEYHLFGAGIGVLLAFLLKGLDPPPPEKKYSWEDEDAEDDDWPFDELPGDERFLGRLLRLLQQQPMQNEGSEHKIRDCRPARRRSAPCGCSLSCRRSPWLPYYRRLRPILFTALGNAPGIGSGKQIILV